MKIGISQPTFLPWQGYLALINYVDEFVILDDVQFDKRSWQQRNKIKQNDKELLLTVPVITKGKYEQNINEVLIDLKKNFREKHLKSIFLSYKKCKYFENYFFKLEAIFNKGFKKLSDLNLNLLSFLLEEMEITTKISFSSNLKLKEKKHNLINKICEIKNCSHYISAKGSEIYLRDLDQANTKYTISYYGFKNLEYSQLGECFIAHLSSLDLLFNLGKDSKNYLEKNFFLIKNDKSKKNF